MEAFKFNENALRSDLVAPKPYEKLLESAKLSVANEESFKERLNPILRQIQENGQKPRL